MLSSCPRCCQRRRSVVLDECEVVLDTPARGRPTRERATPRARCAWSAYLHSAATPASRRAQVAGGVDRALEPVIRTAAFGVMPNSRTGTRAPGGVSTTRRRTRCRPPGSGRRRAGSVARPPHLRDRVPTRTRAGSSTRGRARSTAAKRAGHVDILDSSRSDRATFPTTSSSSTELSASSAAGIPRTTRAPSGVRPSCNPCWCPVWWISVGPVASPASTVEGRRPGQTGPTQPERLVEGHDEGERTRRHADMHMPGGPPAYRYPTARVTNRPSGGPNVCE